MFQKLFLVLSIVSLGGAFCPAHASLTKSDFLSPGDGLLITDTFTNLQWLTPFYTKGHVYNDAFVQSIESTYGFRYATGVETQSMMSSNFNNPTTVANGDAAGFTSATNFMAIFGINEQVTCGSPCPRTQGLTSTPGSTGAHMGFGMITLGSTGWMIVNNNWPDNLADIQMGSFLVRTAASSTPEPASAWLLAAGVSLIAWRRRGR